MSSDSESLSPKHEVKGLWLLRAFRIVVGGWLILSAFVLVDHTNALGVSDVLSGIVVIVLAILSKRWPGLCFAQIPVGLWVIFSPVVIDTGNDVTLYSEIIVGKVLFLSGLAYPKMFEDDD